MEEQLTAILSSFKRERRELIPILQRAQTELGYLPEDVMLEIARFTGVPESKVFAIASFYAQFRLTPMGKNRIMVCRGTACHVSGASRILEEVIRQLGIKVGETTDDLKYTLETVACIGCCALAPCMMINKNVHGRLTLKEVAKIFKSETEEEQ